MTRYQFSADFVSDSANPDWAAILGRAHADKVRPLCLCKATAPQAMYVAIAGNGHAIKRMPYTGPLHAAHCDHYEAPPELSGLGQVSGTAIREDPDEDTTLLSLDFSLSKGRARKAPDGEAAEHDSVRSDGKKLTLRATLHYLLDQAGLSRWSPRMEGKRSWYIVRRELIAAANNKVTKGLALNDVLFIPEQFNSALEHEIDARRKFKLSRLAASNASRMLLIGELKDVQKMRVGSGFQAIVKHLPKMPFRVNEDLYKRITSRFELELALVNQIEASKILLIGTFSEPRPGIFDLETVSLINVNAGYIPFESSDEFDLLEALAYRRYSKGLRFNLPGSAPIASVILHDTPEPTALYVVPADATEAVTTAFGELAADSGLAQWMWNCADGEMPPLPLSASEVADAKHQAAAGVRPTPLPTSEAARAGSPAAARHQAIPKPGTDTLFGDELDSALPR